VQTDVAEGGGPEEGVAERVEEDIGVGVTGQSQGEGDRLSAEDEGAPLAERVNVDALSDPEVGTVHVSTHFLTSPLRMTKGFPGTETHRRVYLP
jgi:hypothetical protein